MINFDDEVENDFEEETIPNLTYKLDKKNKCIVSRCDGREAQEQAIYKILNTEMDAYMAYSGYYGIELSDLIGEDFVYVEGEIQDRIVEAILQDDRFVLVDNFETTREGKKLIVTFTVTTRNGEEIESEVRTNV